MTIATVTTTELSPTTRVPARRIISTGPGGTFYDAASDPLNEMIRSTAGVATRSNLLQPAPVTATGRTTADGSAGEMTQLEAILCLQDGYAVLADPQSRCITTARLMDAANGDLHGHQASPQQKQEIAAAARYFLTHPHEYAALETALGRSTGNGKIAVSDNLLSSGDLAAAANALAAEQHAEPLHTMSDRALGMSQADAVDALRNNYALLADPKTGLITTASLKLAAQGKFHVDATPEQKSEASAAAECWLAHPYDFGVLDTAGGRARRDATAAAPDGKVSFDDLAILADALAAESATPAPEPMPAPLMEQFQDMQYPSMMQLLDMTPRPDQGWDLMQPEAVSPDQWWNLLSQLTGMPDRGRT